jgi:hypothetical protein
MSESGYYLASIIVGCLALAGLARMSLAIRGIDSGHTAQARSG